MTRIRSDNDTVPRETPVYAPAPEMIASAADRYSHGGRSTGTRQRQRRKLARRAGASRRHTMR